MENHYWFENEKDWEAELPTLFNKDRIRFTFLEINKLIKLLGIQEGASVLDLCCGVGRHSIELAKRGFIVTAVDITKAYLAKARETAAAANVAVRFIHSNMISFCQPESFDLVCNLFTSFGYFEDIRDDGRVLDNCYASLKKNGRLVLEMIGKEVVAKNFQEKQWLELDGQTVLEKRKICRDWTWLEYKRLLVKDGFNEETSSCHRMYSAAELKDLVAAHGFKNIRVYGDFSGAPYDDKAKTLLLIAEK